jgi:hypothetical protein
MGQPEVPGPLVQLLSKLQRNFKLTHHQSITCLDNVHGVPIAKIARSEKSPTDPNANRTNKIVAINQALTPDLQKAR